MTTTTFSYKFRLPFRHLDRKICDHIEAFINDHFKDSVVDESFYIQKILSFVVDSVEVNRGNSNVMVSVSITAKILRPEVGKALDGIVRVKNGKVMVVVEDKLVFYVIKTPPLQTYNTGDKAVVRLMDAAHIKYNGKDILCLGEIV